MQNTMADHIHTISKCVRGELGKEYEAQVFGVRRDDGTWAGFIQFHQVDAAVLLHTGQETSQPNRRALDYWAGGLEPIYLQGALKRARET
jgi:hypothetical protein